MGSSSKSRTTTNETTISDDSIVDLSNSDGASFVRLSDINDSNITLTDQGAVKAAFEGLDNSIDAIRENSNSAIAATSKAGAASLKAVTEFGRPDAGATSNPILIIAVVVLGLGAVFILKGKK